MSHVIEKPIERYHSSQTVHFDPRYQGLPGVVMMQVSPSQAQEWLRSNRENRRLRQKNVEYLVRQMSTGGYVAGAAVVAFSTDGRLLNGQHTLNAIIASGCAQTVTVQYGMPESAFGAYDTGLVRSLNDITRLGDKQIAILNCINNAANNAAGRTKMTPDEARLLMSKCHEGFRVLESINNWTVLLSPSMIPAAFIASFYLFPEHRDWHVIILKWLADDAGINASMMRPPIIGAWCIACKNLKDRLSGGASARLDVFLRLMRVFDPECKNNAKIYPANQDIIRSRILQIFFSESI